MRIIGYRIFAVLCRTVLVRYDFGDNTPIDPGAEGGCFAKEADFEFTPHRASHESHSTPGLKKRYSVSVFAALLTPFLRPFSRLFGAQNLENPSVVHSAHERGSPQAPSLRDFGCVNAKSRGYQPKTSISRAELAPALLVVWAYPCAICYETEKK